MAASPSVVAANFAACMGKANHITVAAAYHLSDKLS
jgi:hypothetical protein